MAGTLVEIIINEQIAIANMCTVNVRITPIHNNMFEVPSDSIAESIVLIFPGGHVLNPPNNSMLMLAVLSTCSLLICLTNVV